MFKFKSRKKIKTPQAKLQALLDAHKIDLVFDIGANVGQYAQALITNGYKGRIISFEPLQELHADLADNAKNHKNWSMAPVMAIGKETGKTDINVSAKSVMSSIRDISEQTLTALPGSEYTHSQTVDVYALKDIIDDYSSAQDNVFLKVDTQGLEMDILLGAEDVLDRFTGIQLELSLFPLYEGETLFQDIVDWLYQRGFKSYLVIPGYFSKKLMRQLQIDIIFFRDNE